jgi:iron complex transport system substrate-binding protein
MHRRAFVGGSLALAAAPILGKSLTSFAQEASPAAVTPVLPVTFTDATGVESTITDVSRIVVINGELAEVVYALGLGGNVVAVDATATYPPEAQELPQYGFQFALSAEAILSFQPTLVIGRVGFAEPVEAIEQIRSAGVPVVMVDFDNTIETPGEKIRTLATVLGVPEAGEALATKVEQEIADASALVANVEEKPRVLFVLVRPEQGIQLVGGAGTPLDAMLPAAGAINAGTEAGVQGYQPLTPEALITASPDIMIFQQVGFESSGGAEGILQIPGVAETPAGQNQAFFAYDDLALLALGPRTAEILRQMIADFHPELAVATPEA